MKVCVLPLRVMFLLSSDQLWIFYHENIFDIPQIADLASLHTVENQFSFKVRTIAISPMPIWVIDN